jgi:hypothetical protein
VSTTHLESKGVTKKQENPVSLVHSAKQREELKGPDEGTHTVFTLKGGNNKQNGRGEEDRKRRK